MHRGLVAGDDQAGGEFHDGAQHRAEHAEADVTGVEAVAVVDMAGLGEQAVGVGQHANLEAGEAQSAGQTGGAEPVGHGDEENARSHEAVKS